MKRGNFRLAITLLAGIILAILILEEGQMGLMSDRYDDTRNQLLSVIDHWLQ
ncbi:MAG: hypothetical protein GY768_28455 [Planctomycetaceae bacterium]|nr:hypothetical protein [Planctomycetaceae bacterium]